MIVESESCRSSIDEERERSPCHGSSAVVTVSIVTDLFVTVFRERIVQSKASNPSRFGKDPRNDKNDDTARARLLLFLPQATIYFVVLLFERAGV
jgi:hypothetical protein